MRILIEAAPSWAEVSKKFPAQSDQSISEEARRIALTRIGPCIPNSPSEHTKVSPATTLDNKALQFSPSELNVYVRFVPTLHEDGVLSGALLVQLFRASPLISTQSKASSQFSALKQSHIAHVDDIRSNTELEAWIAQQLGRSIKLY